MLIYTASADRGWPRSSRLGRQFIPCSSLTNDDADNIFKRLDYSDHSWRLLMVLHDPRTAPQVGDALNAQGMLTIPNPHGGLPVWLCVANARSTLEQQWTGYSIDPIVRRSVVPPFTPLHLTDKNIIERRAALIKYRQLAIRQAIFSCCDIRGDGFIQEIFGVVLSLDDTWQSLFNHFRPGLKNSEQCRVWLAPIRLMHPAMAHNFNNLVSFAMDAQSSLGSIGLIEILNLIDQMNEKMSLSMTDDLQMYTIYVWSPASPITFMNSTRYHVKCLSECIDFREFEHVDFEMWACIAATYVWNVS